MKHNKKHERQVIHHLVFFGLICVLLLATSMCIALATDSGIHLDDETGALLESGSNDPVTIDTFNLMLADMRSIDPDIVQLTITPTLDSLTVQQIQTLASGVMPDNKTGGAIAFSITAKTDKKNKFKAYEIKSGDRILASGSNATVKWTECKYELNNKDANYNPSGLFEIMTGEISVTVTDANNEDTTVTTRLSTDDTLLAMIDSGLIANWSDLYFYKAASVTVAVSPVMDAATEINSTATLTATSVPANCVYQWQKVQMNSDGSIPEDGWENIEGAQASDAPMTVDMDSIRYAYRCVAFPNETARNLFLNGVATLYKASNAITLMAEDKRTDIMAAMGNGSITWEDVQFLVSDGSLTANVHERSQSYPGALQDKYSDKITAISPDQMWVTLTAGIGGAESYTWQRSSDNGTTWETIDVTTEPEYSIHMDASTDQYVYRCVAAKGTLTSTSQSVTFSALPGAVWTSDLVGGYVPATGNSAAYTNEQGDYYDSHNNRGQYAFTPAQDANITRYASNGELPDLEKSVPEEVGKEGNANTEREYTIHLKADFTDVKEPDPIVYLISSDMDYATSNLTYARNWDPTIFNIGTGTEIKRALIRFVDAVTSDGSGSFVGYSYTGHNNLPSQNYLYAAPYFTNTNSTAVSAFNTLHTYGVCGNGHWDSGFSQLATCFSGIDRSVVEKFLFGNDTGRIDSIQRVGISIAGSNENGYGTKNSKKITDLFGKGYDSKQDSWYGILTTDGSGQHWLMNSQRTMTQLYTNKTTEDAIYDALMAIHNERYNPSVSDVTITDIVRAEFEVIAPDDANVSVSNDVKTVTWVDAEGDEYTAVCKVDATGDKVGETTVTIHRSSPYYYTKNSVLEKTINIRACDDYIGSNDVFTNHDPAKITYANQMGEQKEIVADDTPTVNVPLRMMDPMDLTNWLLKGDATNLDALGEDFLEGVKAYIYKYEQVHGTLQLQWKLGEQLITESDKVPLNKAGQNFPETDTTGNTMANVSDVTGFTGLILFEPNEATNGKVGVSVINDEPFAQTNLSVAPVRPVFGAASDAVWLGEALNAHNATDWTQPIGKRFQASVPDKSSIAGITDAAYEQLKKRVSEDEYLNRLVFELHDENWQAMGDGALSGNTVIGDLSGVGGKQIYYLSVASMLNGQSVELYSASGHASSGYPVYTVYQAKPEFSVYSYTTGLKTAEIQIQIIHNGDTGLVEVKKPQQAPAWANEAPDMWNMLNNSFDAYRGGMVFSYIASEGEQLYDDETLASSGNSLILTAKRAHGEDRPISVDIAVALSADAAPFITMEPNLYVVSCKLNVTKAVQNSDGFDSDWRFPVNVTGGNLPEDGQQLILAAGETATLVNLTEGTFTAVEDTQWADGWTATTPNGSCTLSLYLQKEDNTYVQSEVYRSDNQMAEADSSRNVGSITITNQYAPVIDIPYLKDEVTNVYEDGTWKQQ